MTEDERQVFNEITAEMAGLDAQHVASEAVVRAEGQRQDALRERYVALRQKAQRIAFGDAKHSIVWR